jgi:hypothetical protein
MLLIAVIVAGCAPATAAGPTTPAAPIAPTTAAPAATQSVTFDPTTFVVLGGQPARAAACAGSKALPNRGAYACADQTGAVLDPCFLQSGNQLVCQPNPLTSNAIVVSASNTLPAVPKTGSPAPFYLQLTEAYPYCRVRGDLTLQFNGQPVTFSCEAPAAWLLGPIDASKPAWTAQYITTDTQGSKVTYGPVVVPVGIAWVY